MSRSPMDQLMREALADEAARPVLQETGLVGVKRRAARVRRRRNAATLAAAAAVVVAVVVPAGLLGERSITSPSRPEPAGTPSGPPASAAPTDAPRSLEAVPLGEAPRIPYTFAGTLHLDRELETDVPWSRAVTSWTPYAGGYLADDGQRLVRFDRRGKQVESWTPGNRPAVSPDGRRVAWLDGDTVISDDVDGGDRRTWTAKGALSVAGFVGDGVVVTTSRGTAVVGARSPLTDLPGTSFVVDVRGDGMAVTRDSEQVTTMLGADGREKWMTTKSEVGLFSPGGQRVWATSPSGTRPTKVQLLSADHGSAVEASLDLGRIPGALVRHVSWEDDDHVLVVVSALASKQQTLLRLGTDGSLARAVPVSSTEGDDVYVFGRA